MSVKTVRIKQNIIRKRYLTNSQKAINIRNTKSHKSDWKGGLYENKLYDDSRRCHELTGSET